ncbi:hypothetical protein DFJ74DRAFT_672940 [Hyaloraphidium curvatum]|nr:hypothetical protein DFJ74DRAFT_672940 [Hyaloraphidium curvatum]
MSKSQFQVSESSQPDGGSDVVTVRFVQGSKTFNYIRSNVIAHASGSVFAKHFAPGGVNAGKASLPSDYALDRDASLFGMAFDPVLRGYEPPYERLGKLGADERAKLRADEDFYGIDLGLEEEADADAKDMDTAEEEEEEEEEEEKEEEEEEEEDDDPPQIAAAKRRLNSRMSQFDSELLRGYGDPLQELWPFMVESPGLRPWAQQFDPDLCWADIMASNDKDFEAWAESLRKSIRLDLPRDDTPDGAEEASVALGCALLRIAQIRRVLAAANAKK